MKKRIVIYIVIATCSYFFYEYGRSLWYPVALKVKGHQTVSDVISKHESSTRNKLAPTFESAGVIYPPKRLALIAIKDEKVMHLWASNDDDNFKLIISYPIKAASGLLGPKLREGDRQVPEGLYNIVGFNPNSSFHLSMKINYPNPYDLKYAKAEGRDQPGTNIFIHGRAVSVGCLAMGDDAIEELFTLVHEVGLANTQVLISPTDPSKNKLVVPNGAPLWTSELYAIINERYVKITNNEN